MSTLETDTLIIGAGPACLAAALELSKEGKDFIIVEAQHQVGGLAKTLTFEEEGGLIFRTDLGPHRFFSKNPYLYECIEGLLHEQWITVLRCTRQYIGGKYYHYPVRFFEALKNVGPLNAARMAFDYAYAKARYGLYRREVRSFQDYIYATFGKRLGEFNMINYTEKIWGIPAREIHKDWAQQRIKGLNVRALLKSALKGRGKSASPDSPKSFVDTFYYPEYGTGLIYETIAKKLREKSYTLLLDAAPVRITTEGDKVAVADVSIRNGGVASIRFRNMIESVPLPHFMKLFDPAPPESLLVHARALRFRSQIYVFLTLDKNSVTKDQWIYFPDQDIPIGRISEMRNFSSRMSPEGKTSLLVEFFCFEGDALWRSSDEALGEMAITWLEKLGFIARVEVRHAYVMRQNDVYPLYDLSYQEHTAPLKQWLDRFTNLYYIGRPGRFRYNNQDHSLEMGIAAARSIISGVREDIERIGEEQAYYEKGHHTVTTAGMEQ